jgi:SAM-dependent MidA family methyltransferase
MPDNLKLYQTLWDRLGQSAQGRLTFAEFMDLVLYHPELGYYSAPTPVIGPEGHFITSPHLESDFAELIGEQCVELWHHLQRPDPFHLVEMGAGQGIMAADLLTYLQNHHRDYFAVLRYLIVERSASLKTLQQRRLQPWSDRVSWQPLEAIKDNSLVGCFFSNELVDALPVHQVVLTEDGLAEVYVTLESGDGNQLQEVIAPLSTCQLRDYFALMGIDLCQPAYPLGYRTEVNLQALDWIKTLACKLRRGYVITIDYGYPAHRYYSPARCQGTLQCYYQHSHHNNPYSHLGQQDITAHVNFTALERQGNRWGLATLGLTHQALFLMGLGLGDRLNALTQITTTDPEAMNGALARRERLQQLISPLGLGNFLVLVQGKNLPNPSTTLSGLRELQISR